MTPSLLLSQGWSACSPVNLKSVFISAVRCGFAKSDAAHRLLAIILTINPEVIFIPAEIAQVCHIRKSLGRKPCRQVVPKYTMKNSLFFVG